MDIRGKGTRIKISAIGPIVICPLMLVGIVTLYLQRPLTTSDIFVLLLFGGFMLYMTTDRISEQFKKGYNSKKVFFPFGVLLSLLGGTILLQNGIGVFQTGLTYSLDVINQILWLISAISMYMLGGALIANRQTLFGTSQSPKEDR